MEYVQIIQEKKMFVIACRYNSKYPNVINLVDQILNYHPNEKIVVVDSDSDDKSYFQTLQRKGVVIEDIKNKNRELGAYWHAFKKYPHEDHYFFLHDSMKLKGSLEKYTKKELTLLNYFHRKNDILDRWGKEVEKKTPFKYKKDGLGCYGPIFFCKGSVMEKLRENKVDTVLPSNKIEGWYTERVYGFFFEELGYNLKEVSLYGDVVENEMKYNSAFVPIDTSWQFPIEKFYGSLQDQKRALTKYEEFLYQIILIKNKRVSFYHFLRNLKNLLINR